jgi:hypothetical protein
MKKQRFTSTLLAKIKADRALLVCVMLVCYAFFISVSAVLSVAGPIGSDTYWHLHISGMIAVGHPDHALQYILQENKFPYGVGISIFHFAEVPLIWSTQPLLLVRVLELLFMPVTFVLTLWLVYKHGGGSAPAAITGITLLGGWAFMDGTLQVRPESIDLILYPVIVAALLTYKKKTFLLSTLTVVYSHGIAALSVIYGLAVSKLRDKNWTRTILLALLLIAPVIIVSCFYVGGAFQKWGGAPPQENPQEYEFWTTPLTFIPMYCGSMLLGVPFLFKRDRCKLETLLLYGLVGSLVMLPIWPDRWLHYASIPLSIYAGIGISKLQGKKKLAAGVLLLTLLMFYWITFMNLSFSGNWWQPGD